MQILVLILVGVALWAVSVGLARRFGVDGGSALADATLGFITVWFLALATSLWVNVAKGQHTLRELLPASALSFGLPALLAAVVQYRRMHPRAASSSDEARPGDGPTHEDVKI